MHGKITKFDFALTAAYLALALIFAYFYRYQWNTDGLGYISIAQKYAAGDFWPAVNGFWSPLYSWLIAVFIVLGAPGMIAAKIVGVAAGLALLLASKKLLDCFDLGGRAEKAVLAALAPISVYCAVSLATPDVLLAAIIVYYLSFVFRRDYDFKNYGLWCGILGGLAYLAKTYAFLIFYRAFSAVWSHFFPEVKVGRGKKKYHPQFCCRNGGVHGGWRRLDRVDSVPSTAKLPSAAPEHTIWPPTVRERREIRWIILAFCRRPTNIR